MRDIYNVRRKNTNKKGNFVIFLIFYNNNTIKKYIKRYRKIRTRKGKIRDLYYVIELCPDVLSDLTGIKTVTGKRR